MIITKTVTLIAAPEPPFVGTTLKISVPADSLTWGIFSITKAADAESVTIDWGDGETTIVTGSTTRQIPHTYASGGNYTVRVSDDASIYSFSTNTANDYQSVYAPMIREASSNATRLTTIGAGAFMNAANLVKADFSAASSLETCLPWSFNNCVNLTDLRLPDGIKKLYSQSFGNCDGLSGRLDFPAVNQLIGSGENSPPFLGSDNITEIHLAAAYEAAIRSSASFKVSATLGAPNATVVFDL